MNEGRVLTHPARAREWFRSLVERPDSELDLTEASLVVALEEYPAIQVAEYLRQIDHWSRIVEQRLRGRRSIEIVIETINRVLFDDEGFHAGEDDYYDPRYAFLNEVLDRHEGLPLALSIVYIEIGRRIGYPFAGVPLPGRFLVKVSGAWGEVLIDPFDAGRVLTTAECQDLLDRLYGGGVRLREHHLRASSNHEVLTRLLAHLKKVHLARHDLAGALAAVERLLLLDASDGYEWKDRANIEMQLHRYGEAIDDLRRYLELVPHADDRRHVEARIETLGAWLTTN